MASLSDIKKSVHTSVGRTDHDVVNLGPYHLDPAFADIIYCARELYHTNHKSKSCVIQIVQIRDLSVPKDLNHELV